jgi:signal transduction histidine kinase
LGGLNQLDLSSGRVTVYKNDPEDPTSLGYGEVGTIYEDRSGTLWVGTIGGLDRFNRETGTFSAVEAFRGQPVTAILEDQQGGLWIGGWGGVARREPGAAFTPLETGEGLPAPELVQALYIDRYGTLWISTQDKGLFRLDPGEKSRETTPRLIHFPKQTGNPNSPGISPVMSFYEDRQGTLWMGSVDDGLVRFIPDSQTFTHYIPSTGIARYVGCIQGDAQGYLWMGTVLGLARFDPRTETFTHFDARDGLEIGLGIDCIQNEQGEMFFTSLNGVNRFFPEQIPTNPKPPEVVITSLNLFSQPFRTDLKAGEAIQLAYNKNYLSFDFAALDFTVPTKNQYAYKMEGLDPDWIEAGTRRHADYPDLKPGSYTFRVKASNNSGVWNEQGTAVQISITPPFWQTWWFLSIVGLALVGGTLEGLRLRVRSLEARSRELEKQVHDRTSALEQKTLELQQQTQETEQRRQELEALLIENTRLSKQSQELAVLEERNRLARDLHDSITQSMYGVTLYAEVATQLLKYGEVEKASTHLQELKAMALDSLAEMRLMIYELRPSVFEQEGLVAAIQARLESVEGRVGLKTNFTIRGEISLTSQLEAGLYRIAQEALNNVLKHAHASHVSITLAQDARSIYMEIVDDGVGFDPFQKTEAGCQGLRNMQERAQELGITFEILSQAGKGTKIILKRLLT